MYQLGNMKTAQPPAIAGINLSSSSQSVCPWRAYGEGECARLTEAHIVLVHPPTIHWKTHDCRQPRRPRLQIGNDLRKHQVRLFGPEVIDDCELFWLFMLFTLYCALTRDAFTYIVTTNLPLGIPAVAPKIVGPTYYIFVTITSLTVFGKVTVRD